MGLSILFSFSFFFFFFLFLFSFSFSFLSFFYTFLYFRRMYIKSHRYAREEKIVHSSIFVYEVTAIIRNIVYIALVAVILHWETTRCSYDRIYFWILMIII